MATLLSLSLARAASISSILMGRSSCSSCCSSSWRSPISLTLCTAPSLQTSRRSEPENPSVSLASLGVEIAGEEQENHEKDEDKQEKQEQTGT